LLGNDIVDIEFCEPPKYRHVRYLDRVCTPEEADGVRRSPDPAKALALIWASKEAAYKAFSKQLPECHFVPREFVIQVEHRDPIEINQKLSILYAGLQTEVSIFAKEGWVHAVAAFPGMRIRWAVREIEECFLGDRKASSESEAVRFLANALIEELGLQDASLQFDGRVPKLTRKGGGSAGIDVSLSHDGAFAAAAIGWPLVRRVGTPWDETDFAETKSSEAICSTCTA
jgi:phosphopantetheinyl transferase (holo-ACP synthase)